MFRSTYQKKKRQSLRCIFFVQVKPKVNKKKSTEVLFYFLLSVLFFYFERIKCVKVSILPVYVLGPAGKAKTVYGIIFFWRHTT